jgi:hypothetical protein
MPGHTLVLAMHVVISDSSLIRFLYTVFLQTSQDRLQPPEMPRDSTLHPVRVYVPAPARVQTIKVVRDHHQGVRPMGHGGLCWTLRFSQD